VKAGINPDNSTHAYIGIRTQENDVLNSGLPPVYGVLSQWNLFPLINLLTWIFVLNFAVGIINLLPARPLDGGLLFEEILTYRISKTTVNRITNGLTIVLWTILVVSIVYGTGRGILMLF
jgi:membrane-associated protease RseP (regulator of RpoE activity)